MISIFAGMFFVVGILVGRLIRIRTTERIHCPVRDQIFQITFERKPRLNWAPGKKVDVISCSAFENPEDVDCEKVCLAESVEPIDTPAHTSATH